MGSKTSLMYVISPRYWGFERVDIFYPNHVRASRYQHIVKSGEYIRDLNTGIVWEFVSRKDDSLKLNQIVLS